MLPKAAAYATSKMAVAAAEKIPRLRAVAVSFGRWEHPADREDQDQLRSASLLGAHPAPDSGEGEVLTARKMLYGIKRRVESR